MDYNKAINSWLCDIHHLNSRVFPVTSILISTSHNACSYLLVTKSKSACYRAFSYLSSVFLTEPPKNHERSTKIHALWLNYQGKRYNSKLGNLSVLTLGHAYVFDKVYAYVHLYKLPTTLACSPRHCSATSDR